MAVDEAERHAEEGHPDAHAALQTLDEIKLKMKHLFRVTVMRLQGFKIS